MRLDTGRQLELFPPGTYRKIVWMHDPRYRFGNGWRWMCTKCLRGGCHYSSPQPNEYLMRWAEKNHKCRLFYTDSLVGVVEHTFEKITGNPIADQGAEVYD